MDQTAILSLLGSKATFALFVVYLMNWLKKSKWAPFINYETDKVNHYVAIVLSGLATLGVHIVHTGTVMGGGTITITIPALSVLVTTLWDWVQQYLLTKFSYSVLQDKLKTTNGSPAKAVPLVSTPQGVVTTNG